MAHISKKKLETGIAEILGDQLLTFLSAARSKTDARVLATELFTKTERIMLAKRLATVIMLERGYSFSQIEEALKVTPQTISRVWKAKKDGGYTKIARYAKEYTNHFKKADSFFDILEKLMLVGSPRAPGRAIGKALRKSLAG